MTTTSALVVDEAGTAAVREVELAEPAPGRARVQVAAVGVNFVDTYQRDGVYPVPRPFVLCSEGAGTVQGTGERVAWAQWLGSGAGLVDVPREALVPVPERIDLETAAAVMLQGLTAHYLVTSTFPATAGDTALVHAAAGGVGRLLVQMLTARGVRVVATAGGPEKTRIARELGADVAIDYRAGGDLAQQVREATAGRGVDVVYDGVGRDTFDASLASLRPRGMLALFGAASGQVPPVDLQRLNSGGSLFVTRPTLAHHVADREELLWRAGEVLGAVADGSLQVWIGGRYPLAEAARAYADLEGRLSTGKLLLLP